MSYNKEAEASQYTKLQTGKAVHQLQLVRRVQHCSKIEKDRAWGMGERV